ncbi:SusC/RagA family TonB-linked outer membrane protein [Persicitalea jodogahamensis]|uniref:SusC/RagA family TonB-linked outer membrane protein n=1 Tax=Persicitalea jodogahamensis TaxID=402147 RepID=A0A8J3GCU6_9BACT|nr:TonB-dependent receptor [Persicitalea jodogahamensis]GHB86806.1 SusC/RagA family TonB-linked outer membrane protein [Persicitalea jodogahamensis]
MKNRLLNQLWGLTLLLSLVQWATAPPVHAQGADKTITGRVTDQSNSDPLPGVNVLVKGTTVGTTTDAEGTFRVTAPANAETLVFSYVGYLAEEVAINNRSVIDIGITPDVKSLSEVIVVGYGTQQKRDLVSAISTVDAKQIEKVPTASFTQALQGAVPGLQMVSPSGEPNAPARILIRGVGSITTGTEPLFIVDGLPVASGGTSPLTYLNPNDIESVSVLKDASATSIYGSRGANGVVLITTKTGKQGKAQFNLSYNVGYTTPINELELADADEWRTLVGQARTNSGLTDPFRKEQDLFDQRQTGRFVSENIYDKTNTDWVNKVKQNGHFSQYGFSASNGTEKASYFISGQYRDQTGNFINTRFQRYTGRVNLDFQAAKYLKLGVRYTYSFEDEQPRATISPAVTPTDRNINWGAWPTFGNLYDNALPILPERWANGDAFDPLSLNNITYSADRTNSKRDVTESNQLASLFAELTPLKGFVLRAEGGVNYTVNNDQNWVSGRLRAQEFRPEDTGLDNRFQLDYIYDDGVPRFTWYDRRSWTFNTVGTASYKTEFGTDHRLNALAGIELIHSDRETWQNDWEDAASVRNPSEVGAFVRNPEQLLEITHNLHPQVRFFSQFGRVNYSFRDRYLLQGSIRRDGSSKFTPEDRFSWFPSLSGGWVISDEPFFRKDTPLSFLKLRGGWGITGNANIDPFLYFNQYFNWPNYPNRSGAIILGRLGSRTIQWERSNTYDAALQFGLFNDRINGSIGYYYTKTTNLLLDFPVAPSIGVYGTNTINTTALDNVGSMQNQGIELEINSVNVTAGSFRWSSAFNFTTNKNKVLELFAGFDGDPLQLSFNGLTTVQEGQPLGLFYLPEFAGYDDSGNVLVREIDREKAAQQEYVFTGNDVRNTGNSQNVNSVIQYGKTGLPTFYGGFNNTFSYKGLSLNVLFTFQGGNYVYDNIGLRRVGNGNNNLRKDLVGNTWTPQNTDAPYPVLTWNNRENQPLDPSKPAQSLSDRSTQNLHKGDFMRLRTVNLSYALPNGLFKKNFMKGANVFVNLNNVATFSKFSVVDPEVLNNGGPTERNIGQGVIGGVPLWQVFTASAGVNINL